MYVMQLIKVLIDKLDIMYLIFLPFSDVFST